MAPNSWRIHPLDILKVCQASLKVLTKAFHSRKRTQHKKEMSLAARFQEINRLQGRLRRAIQAITGEYIPSRSMEELAADDPRFVDMDPPTCAELLELLQTQVSAPFETPPELRDRHGLHDGTITFEDIVSDYPLFRKTFSSADWNIPTDTLVPEDEILFKIHHAISHVPNRGKVTADLNPLVSVPPSYDDFKGEIHKMSKDTAGGMSGLTYSMMKAWPEELTRMVYDHLSSLWIAKVVPDWWKCRWVAPIPKNPKEPTLAELRPIVLLEVMRKCWTALIVGRIMRSVESRCP